MKPGRRRTVAGTACAVVVLALSSLWFAGLEAGSPGAVRAHAPSRLYPGAWPPAARGFLWLAAGAAAVGFDLLIVRARAETQRGKDLATAFALVTGIAFLVISIASFADASWSVIY